MNRKSTNIELAQELEALNKDGKYDHIIMNARNCRYHDFKNPEDVICGKMDLIYDLAPFPELSAIRSAVMHGHYDESPDEEDKEMMRQDIPESIWRHFGL